MKIPRRPGVDPKWSRSWKADAGNLVKWRNIYGPRITKELDHYARHGRRLTPPPTTKQGYRPYQDWENNNLDSDLFLLGLLRLFELEQSGMAGKAFDSTLAMQAFAAVYTSQMVALEYHNQSPARHGEPSSDLETEALPFTALGLVAGCGAEALKLARAQTAAHRKGWYENDSADFPVFIFILRMLAAHLEEPAIRPNRAAAHPILDALFDLWRAPVATEELQQVCLAACDFHTHRYKEGGEFQNRDWTRLPVEILLLFKLRQLAGLQNPQLDHPLMNTALGKLPEEVAFTPDELVKRVRATMTKSGYDEEAILANAIKPLKS